MATLRERERERERERGSKSESHSTYTIFNVRFQSPCERWHVTAAVSLTFDNDV
jgi:hypothetical protein